MAVPGQRLRGPSRALVGRRCFLPDFDVDAIVIVAVGRVRRRCSAARSSRLLGVMTVWTALRQDASVLRTVVIFIIRYICVFVFRVVCYGVPGVIRWFRFIRAICSG